MEDISKSKKILAVRWLGYATGLIILALGLTLNTKTQLGVSPILSVSYSISEIYKLNFGDITFIVYILFVIVEIIIHIYLKQYRDIVIDVLQIAFSVVFTRFLNLFKLIVPDFIEDLGGTIWGSMPSRFIFLIISILLTGIGAAMTLNARIIPNPADGFVQAISDLTKKEIGFIKNCTDLVCVIITLIFCMIVIGKPVGIGIGTLCAMLGVGRVIALYNKLINPKKLQDPNV